LSQGSKGSSGKAR